MVKGAKVKVLPANKKHQEIMTNNAVSKLLDQCMTLEQQLLKAKDALRAQIIKNVEDKTAYDKRVEEITKALPGALEEWEAHKAKHEEAEEVLQELGYSYQEGMGYVHKDDQRSSLEDKWEEWRTDFVKTNPNYSIQDEVDFLLENDGSGGAIAKEVFDELYPGTYSLYLPKKTWASYGDDEYDGE